MIGAGSGSLLIANLAIGIAMLFSYPTLTSFGMFISLTLLEVAAAGISVAAAK